MQSFRYTLQAVTLTINTYVYMLAYPILYIKNVVIFAKTLLFGTQLQCCMND